MALEGWYYLHENGDLIYKGAAYTSVADFRESDLVRAFWPVEPGDREKAWTTVVEALAGGARPEKVRELADEWGCDDDDALEYVRRIDVTLVRDGSQWRAYPSDVPSVFEAPYGLGVRAYEALAELARALDYRPSKAWGYSFASLVHRARAA